MANSISSIKLNLTTHCVNSLYNLLYMNNSYTNQTVCLAFFCNAEIYYRFIVEHQDVKELIIIDNYITDFECLCKMFKHINIKIYNYNKISFDNMPHFDVAIMNPPYNVAVRIFEKVLDISTIIITVQPTKWLMTEKQNKSIINKLKSVYCNVKIINGNEYFTAKFAQDLSINYIDKTKKKKIIVNGKEYTEFSEIKKYSSDEKLECFAKKIENVKDSIWDHIKGTNVYYYGYEANPNEYWWIIKIPEIRGNVSKTGKKESDDFYTIISNDETLINKVKGQFKNVRYIKNSRGNTESGYFAFDTEKELNNFIKYIKTDFVRACLMLTKTHNNQFRGCFKKVPWFDFSDPHFEKTPREIDDWLFNKYKIPNEIRKHIEEILPDYYNIRQNND